MDRDGIKTTYTTLTFEWQDGKKLTVRPDVLSPGRRRFPAPPSSRRR
jgi:hypothetical protein